MNLVRLLPLTGVTALALLFVTGCDGSKKDPTPPPVTNQAALPKPPVRQGDADLLSTLPSAGPLTAEGRAWEELVKSLQPPEVPPEWQTTPPSEAALAEFQRKQGALAGEAADKMRDFHTKYPTNEHAAEARDMERQLLGVSAQIGNTNAQRRLLEMDEARLKDPSLPEDERLQIKVQALERSITERKDTNMAANLVALETGVRALQKEFPKRTEIPGLLLGVAEGWIDNAQPDKARKLAQEIAEAKPDAEILEAAQAILKKLDRIGKPLEIKFKAIDGREVDVQAMKGKVVLVDFWATWCGPCVAELPKVKALYEKLHPKGFEIVGISFDQEKPALEKMVASEKMAWPQFFDESGGKGNK